MNGIDEFWVGLATWVGWVLTLVGVMWVALAVLDKKLRAQQARREARAVAQAEQALVEWRQRQAEADPDARPD